MKFGCDIASGRTVLPARPPRPRSVPRVSVGLEEHLDVGDAVAVAHAIEELSVDETFQAFVAVAVERPGRDDEQPARVPDRAPDQATIVDRLTGLERSAVVVSAET